MSRSRSCSRGSTTWGTTTSEGLELGFEGAVHVSSADQLFAEQAPVAEHFERIPQAFAYGKLIYLTLLLLISISVDDIAVAGAGAKFGGAAQPLRQAPENRPGTGPDASPPRKSSQQSATQPPPTQHVEEEQEVLQLSSTRLPAEVPTAECQKQQ